jgi:putative FmdB family regulatory protein
MPTYEYACTTCGQHVEVFQRVSDDPLTECGACGGPLKKVFHPAGILFKGSGFYATDNRKATDSRKEPASEGTGASSDAGSSSSKGPSGPSEGSSGSKGTEGSSPTRSRKAAAGEKSA